MIDNNIIRSLIRQRIIDVMEANTPHEPPAWTLAIACIAANQLMTVGIAHDAHHERRVQVSCGAVVIAETVYTDGESETALNCVYRWREILKVEGFEDENI